MVEYAGIASLLLLVPLMGWYWFGKVRSAVLAKRMADRDVRNRGGRRSAEMAEEAGLALFRTAFLAVLSLGGVLAGLYWLVPAAGNPGVKLEVSNLDENIQRLILAAIAFTVLYALAVGILPQIFPDLGARKTRIVSETTALLIAAFFAISVGTSDDLFDRFSDMLVNGAAEIFAAFIGILFAAIGVFLVWRRLTTTFRPSGARKGGLLGRGDRENQNGSSR